MINGLAVRGYGIDIIRPESRSLEEGEHGPGKDLAQFKVEPADQFCVAIKRLPDFIPEGLAKGEVEVVEEQRGSVGITANLYQGRIHAVMGGPGHEADDVDIAVFHLKIPLEPDKSGNYTGCVVASQALVVAQFIGP